HRPSAARDRACERMGGKPQAIRTDHRQVPRRVVQARRYGHRMSGGGASDLASCMESRSGNDDRSGRGDGQTLRDRDAEPRTRPSHPDLRRHGADEPVAAGTPLARCAGGAHLGRHFGDPAAHHQPLHAPSTGKGLTAVLPRQPGWTEHCVGNDRQDYFVSWPSFLRLIASSAVPICVARAHHRVVHLPARSDGAEGMQVVSVNVSKPKDVVHDGAVVSTGIFKEPVKGRLWVRKLGIEGDGQADLTAHGGPDQAVYAYPVEHYAYWEEQLGRDPLPFGQFGENLSIT